ncbi:Scr1 family TA system antitoxin-like transcriptional regulator [Saccharopolyspora pogona]|uniref:Scr1 family TA system antitoxin-like transcriptional regulator n=1 Tax=Saccharopolyspora pogona TaxID=333966 RepID=UPI0037CC51FA
MRDAKALAESREIEIIVAERALRDALGGPRVMAQQLRHLAEVSERPNITTAGQVP